MWVQPSILASPFFLSLSLSHTHTTYWAPPWVLRELPANVVTFWKLCTITWAYTNSYRYKNLVLGVKVPLRHKVPHLARCFSCICCVNWVIFFFFNWSMVGVQYFVNYFYPAKWFTYTHTHTHTHTRTLCFIFFSIMVNHRILNIVLCAIQGDLVYPFYVWKLGSATPSLPPLGNHHSVLSVSASVL